jgi:hypothetical protein
MLKKAGPLRRDAERWLNETRKSGEIGRTTGFHFCRLRPCRSPVQGRRIGLWRDVSV